MATTNDKYIPALGQHWLTPLYDPLQRWGMREARFKQKLLEQARIQAGHRVLELGCGTGTLTIQIKQSCPQAEVVGLDADPQVLAIATAKAAKAGADIKFDQGMASQLPYADHSFDRVLSSLVLHHLTTEQKQCTFLEVVRVLKLGGELHVVDFGKPRSAFGRLVAFVMVRFEQAADNVTGLLPAMMRTAGFEAVEETAHFMTIVGSLSLYRARVPRG